MKRIFTLLFVAIAVITARATDYNVPITIIINGIVTEQTGTITVVENDGLYDLTFNNFMLESENGPMGVGNVALKGIKPYQDGNATLLMALNTISITRGDDPEVAFWMADILPPVPVNLRAKIVDEHLRVFIDIDLRETELQQTIQVAIGDGYQLPNQSFEFWHASVEGYEEPNGWHSFESATGDLAALAGHHIDKSADAHSGEASARIFATSIFGIVANGTMTTGRMNAGSMSATDPANHAYVDMSMTDLDGNGDPFYIPLYARPDSVAAWVKFKQGTPNSTHPYATISAVITDGTRYQDPEDQAYTNVVAKASNNQIAVTDGQWVRVTAPFVYTENSIDPKAVLITVSTNADAGQGSGNDEVLVDDIELIYNASITGLKVKGQEVPGFSPSTESTTYEMEADGEVTVDDIEVTVDGKTSHIVKEVIEEDGAYRCSVDVFGEDLVNGSSCIILVKSSAAAIRSLNTDNTSSTYFMLDGRQVKTLTSGRIYIRRQANGAVTKIKA